MFVFHGFKIDPRKWKFIKSVANSELSSEDYLKDLDQVLQEHDWLDKRGDPKDLEIDVVTVDPFNGVIVWETKSKNEASNSCSDKRRNDAHIQLQKDADIISWLLKNFAGLIARIKKVAVLTDDEITTADNANWAKSDYTILDCVGLSDFSKWFQTNFKSDATSFKSEVETTIKSDLEMNESIYRKLVPVMVGLSATLCQLKKDTKMKKNFEASYDKKGVCPPDAVARLDSEIDQQKLTRRLEKQKEPITDIVKTKTEKDAKLKFAESLEILFLTPQQQKILNSSSNGVKMLQGPSGSGKTILILAKVLEICSREPKEKVAIICNGVIATKYYEVLTNQGIKCRRDGKKYDDELVPSEPVDSFEPHLIGFTGLESQVLILDQNTLRYDDSHAQHCISAALSQNFHVFFDDADLLDILTFFPDFKKRANQQFLSWVVTDHHQCLQTCHRQLANGINGIMLRKEDEHFKLEYILRNSVEIQQFNAALASHIAEFPQIIHWENIIPKQGSCFCGPPVEVYELYQRDFLNIPITSSNRERYSRRYAKFTAYIFANIIKSGALIDNVPILKSGKYFFSDYPSHLSEALIETGHTSTDYYKKWSNLKDFASAAVLENSYCTQSLEWERVLADAGTADRLTGVAAADMDYELRDAFVYLYLACSRARSQLYLVVPPMFWDLTLSKLGIPDNSAILKKVPV